jgi:hypothetical protein
MEEEATIGDSTQYARLRRDVGAAEDLLTDEIAETYFVESLERYPDDTTKMRAYTRVLALRGIRASAAMLGKYAQNQAQDDLTKVFDNLTVMLEDYTKEVAVVSDPIETNVSPFFFGVASGRRGR